MTDPNNEPKNPSVNAENNSIAVGGISAGGDVSGNIHIGNTGYTADQVSILITQIQSTFQPKPFDGRCPYKGLDVFEEEDAELFFGREKLVDDLVNRVKESRTVFVTGPSGSGKSSLVRAGLIHALKQGAIKNSERWLYAIMKPGRDPIGELGRVASALSGSTNAEDEIRAKAIEDTTIFARWCEIALKEGRDKRVVLFIDQFEEIFTQISKEERVTFLNLLTHAATIENGRVVILFSMRSDFVSNCATYPQLNELLSKQFRQIGAMQPDELVSAIAQPALRVGFRIDPDLIAQIINEMKGEPGALPLMQFALKDLFDSQQEKSGVIALTLNDYLQRGGIHKALERHADDSFSKLSKNEQELARSIFSGLIEIGRGTQDTRRTALFDELIPANTNAEDVEAIVQKLADVRLLTTDEAAGKDTVTISHEKLIDAWPWLKKLVNENRDVIALQNEISADAKEWEERKRDASYLYTGARLINAREKLEAKNLVLSGNSYEFVKAGQVQQRRGQVARMISISAIIGLVIVALTIYIYQSNKLLVQNLASLNTQVALVSTSQAIAVTAEANAEEAQKQTNIAIARQIAAQAQSLFISGNSNQQTAALLAIQSMRLFPVDETAQILQNNLLAKPISQMVHAGWVESVAFSPDGKYVVSGSEDNTARVWEVETGKEVARMTHGGSVNSVAFSPDGKYIVSGSSDGTARVWEAATGKEISQMRQDYEVYVVLFSPNGKYIASGGCDQINPIFLCIQGSARIWEATTGKEIARMIHADGVSFVAFSLDSKYLISGACDKSNYARVNNSCTQSSARVWDAETGNEVARMTHNDNISSLAFSTDGKYVVSGSIDGTARVWEAASGKEITYITMGDSVNSVAFSPDGKFIASGGCDEKGIELPRSCTQGSARVWDAETGKEIAHMIYEDSVLSLAFSPDGKYVVSGSVDGTASVWEAATGKEISLIKNYFYVNSVAFSSDGKYVVSTGDNVARVWEAEMGKEIIHIVGRENSVAFSPDSKYMVSVEGYTASMWEVETRKEISHMTHGSYVISVAFSQDGKYVVSGSADGTARVWEAESGKEISHMNYEGTVLSVAFSPNGKYVVSGSADGTLHVWETETGKEVSHMRGNADSVAFSPNSKYVVSAGGWTVSVWEVETGKEVSQMKYEESYVASASFSPDSKYVVSAGDYSAKVWEIETGKEIASQGYARLGPSSPVTSAAFSPDGRYVVSGSEDGSASVWKVETGEQITYMTHEEGSVMSVAFSPDGKYVVSGVDNGTARIWESFTGKEIARLTQSDSITSVSFSPNGKYLVTESYYDGVIRIWVYHPLDLIAETCSRVTYNLTIDEWGQYIGDALQYQAVCPNVPLDFGYISAIASDALLNSDDPIRVKTALAKVQTEFTKVGNTKDPVAESFRIVSSAILYQISTEITYKDREKTLDLFEQAGQIQMQISFDDKNTLNKVCWDGSLNGYEEQVLQFCELAVKLAPNDAAIRDSRGLARALTGNYQGAILDFQYFVTHTNFYYLVEQRIQWVEKLKSNTNPFTPDVLESLKLPPEIPVKVELSTTPPPPHLSTTQNTPLPCPTLVSTLSDSLININTASQCELESLPGVGPTTAQMIVDYLSQNGPFATVEDIMNVSGVGPTTFESIKSLITVSTFEAEATSTPTPTTQP